MFSFRLTIFALVLTLLVASTGCQGNKTYKQIAAKNPVAKNTPKTPTRMAVFWTPYAQTVPDGLPMRGLAGRVHFYHESKKPQTIKVDGNMTVFVFDGNVKDPAHAKPLKIFVFKSETLAKHYSFKKPLGHGYDFFLPFDTIGGEEKNLCLLARFDDVINDKLITSMSANTILKGSKPEGNPESETKVMVAQDIPKPVQRNLDIRQTGVEIESVRQPATTISLPDSMHYRLTQTPAP